MLPICSSLKRGESSQHSMMQNIQSTLNQVDTTLSGGPNAPRKMWGGGVGVGNGAGAGVKPSLRSAYYEVLHPLYLWTPILGS